MSNPSTDTQPTNQNRRITTSKGSPFSPGIPLEAHQPIFGRDDAFRFISGELMRFKSVNLIGERRMGKTSLLKHLLGNQDKYLQPYTQQPPLVLIHVDLQDNISKAEQFYGKALRGLVEALPLQAGQQTLESWRARLRERPEATAIEFENVVKSFKEAESERVRPVFLIDEFERVFEQHLRTGFPFPDFYDGLRAQITANRVAIVLFTREKLINYFTQQSLTSTFPSYFQPFTLRELEKEAADALLLRQPSDHPLTTEQARQALSWAGLHPCRLQCAGAACYQANSEKKPARWAKKRYQEIVEQLGFVNPSHLSVKSAKGLLHRLKQPRYWLPLSVATGLGVLAWFHKMHWLTGLFSWCKENWLATVILILMTLILFGKVNGEKVIKVALDKFLGEGKEEKK
jgi:uncharacterized protein